MFPFIIVCFRTILHQSLILSDVAEWSIGPIKEAYNRIDVSVSSISLARFDSKTFGVKDVRLYGLFFSQMTKNFSDKYSTNFKQMRRWNIRFIYRYVHQYLHIFLYLYRIFFSIYNKIDKNKLRPWGIKTDKDNSI